MDALELLADCVLRKSEEAGEEIEFWCEVRAREPKKERVKVLGRRGCVSCREVEDAGLFLGVQDRSRRRALRYCAAGRELSKKRVGSGGSLSGWEKRENSS